MSEEKKDTETKKEVIKLNTPYKFEDKEYTEIDLSGMDKLKIGDMIDIQRQLMDNGQAAAMAITETSTAFSLAVAAKVTEQPIEFFETAPVGLARKVKAMVWSKLNQNDDSEGHEMKFYKPYVFKGKTYNSVDLTEVGNLTGMNVMEAENEVTRSGFYITETSYNYLYCCIVAGMATGLGTDFFKGLPFAELAKLRNEVNHPDFFA